MNTQEFALLFAISLPVLVIAGIQAYLWIAGERGTGLVPGFARYPSIELGKSAALQPVVSTAPSVATPVESSNDEVERIAA